MDSNLKPLDRFLMVVQSRIPTVQEMVDLCDSLGIGFASREDGTPVLKPNKTNRAEALLLAKLFRREPFRSQVLAAKLKGTHAATRC